MRFFIRVDDRPDADTYGQPISLHRFDLPENKRVVIAQRWDKREQRWKDDPQVILFTGIGGADNFREVRKEKALTILEKWHDVDDHQANIMLASDGRRERPRRFNPMVGLSTADIEDDSLFVALHMPNHPGVLSAAARVLDAEDTGGLEILPADEHHVTLLFAQECSEAALKQFLKNLVVPSPLQLSIVEGNTFNNEDGQVIIMKVAPSQELLTFQRHLADVASDAGMILSPYSKETHYLPHITLAYNRRSDEETISHPRLDIPVVATSLVVARPDWQIVKEFSLGG